MVHKKQFLFFNWFKEIIEIFGESEVGCSDIDIDALSEYLCSDKFPFDTFEYNTEEEAQEYITNYILEGFPAWRYLKCSDWTKNMVEKSFTQECEYEWEQLKKEYKCYTCKYYKTKKTMMGILEKCISPTKDGFISKREAFEPQKKCCEYERMDEDNG